MVGAVYIVLGRSGQRSCAIVAFPVCRCGCDDVDGGGVGGRGCWWARLAWGLCRKGETEGDEVPGQSTAAVAVVFYILSRG